MIISFDLSLKFITRDNNVEITHLPYRKEAGAKAGLPAVGMRLNDLVQRLQV